MRTWKFLDILSPNPVGVDSLLATRFIETTAGKDSMQESNHALEQYPADSIHCNTMPGVWICPAIAPSPRGQIVKINGGGKEEAELPSRTGWCLKCCRRCTRLCSSSKRGSTVLLRGRLQR